MAHYAFLDNNNVVTEVITGKDETEILDGLTPENWYSNFKGQNCKRTSFFTIGGVHLQGKTQFRKNFAGVGYSYDPVRDAFIPPKCHEEATINEDTCLWDCTNEAHNPLEA